MRLGGRQLAFGGSNELPASSGMAAKRQDVWELLLWPARMYFQMPKGGIHL